MLASYYMNRRDRIKAEVSGQNSSFGVECHAQIADCKSPSTFKQRHQPGPDSLSPFLTREQLGGDACKALFHKMDTGGIFTLPSGHSGLAALIALRVFEYKSTALMSKLVVAV